jgi:hypothetical protein
LESCVVAICNDSGFSFSFFFSFLSLIIYNYYLNICFSSLYQYLCVKSDKVKYVEVVFLGRHF